MGNVNAFGLQNDVMFFVRSKVASYWRGRTLDTFDGQYWLTSGPATGLVPSANTPGMLINQESRGLDNRLRYSQTFFIQQDVADSIFTGYRGVRIIAEEGSLRGAGVRAGDSYRVVSAHPRHTLTGLRLSHAGWLGSKYLSLPPNSGRLRELARQITEGSTSDFARMERIMGYLSLQDNYDRNRPGDLTSSASLGQFLFENQKGSALDYATATVMLARASGLSSRLAMGYLPGVRDPLSGAYLVRESDAHAWAEVYFEGQGWVPIDNAPRPDIKLLFDEGGGTGPLLSGGLGEKAFQAVQATPGKVAETIPELVNHQALWAGSAALFLVVSVALSWRRFWWQGRRRRGAEGAGLAYSLLSGDQRREVLQLYRRVEKLLHRSIDVAQREPWQTVGTHNQWAAAGGTELQEQVSEQVNWFTGAVWQAAYNPEEIGSGLAAEARQRLERLKRALRGQIPPELERFTPPAS
jgi:transglutaminase-like putative cysteine protease